MDIKEYVKINKIIVINEKDSLNFIREFNSNTISKDFLQSCEKAGKLFKQGK